MYKTKISRIIEEYENARDDADTIKNCYKKLKAIKKDIDLDSDLIFYLPPAMRNRFINIRNAADTISDEYPRKAGIKVICYEGIKHLLDLIRDVEDQESRIEIIDSHIFKKKLQALERVTGQGEQKLYTKLEERQLFRAVDELRYSNGEHDLFAYDHIHPSVEQSRADYDWINTNMHLYPDPGDPKSVSLPPLEEFKRAYEKAYKDFCNSIMPAVNAQIQWGEVDQLTDELQDHSTTLNEYRNQLQRAIGLSEEYEEAMRQNKLEERMQEKDEYKIQKGAIRKLKNEIQKLNNQGKSVENQERRLERFKYWTGLYEAAYEDPNGAHLRIYLKEQEEAWDTQDQEAWEKDKEAWEKDKAAFSFNLEKLQELVKEADIEAGIIEQSQKFSQYGTDETTNQGSNNTDKTPSQGSNKKDPEQVRKKVENWKNNLAPPEEQILPEDS